MPLFRCENIVKTRSYNIISKLSVEVTKNMYILHQELPTNNLKNKNDLFFSLF